MINMTEDRWPGMDSTPIDLASKYPAGLNSEPDLSDLMNEVAAAIPSKWKDVGLQLGLEHGVLLGIRDHCYMEVFTQWKNQNSITHPFTWLTMVQVLRNRAVGEKRLADKIESELNGHTFTTEGIREQQNPGYRGKFSHQVGSGPSTSFATLLKSLMKMIPKRLLRVTLAFLGVLLLIVLAKLVIQQICAPINIIVGVSYPWGVAVSDNGEIAVTEWGDHCVSIFAQNGTKIRTFGSVGSAQGQFSHPRGVAFDSAGNILVVDGDNHRIQKFTAEGKFLTAVGRKGYQMDMEFYYPNGVAMNHKDKKVYVCDTANHRVQILNENLTFSSSFGGSGSGDGQFNYPWDVAFDSTGSVYVADSCNHRIQVFTPEGRFLREFGRKGSGEGELNYPSSVSIDSEDRVHVTDKNNHRVSIFNYRGKFVKSFQAKGLDFSEPGGIAVDTRGLVYVSDTLNYQVLIYSDSISCFVC